MRVLKRRILENCIIVQVSQGVSQRAGFNCDLSKYYVTFSLLVSPFPMCKSERFSYYHARDFFRIKVRNDYEVLQFCGSEE